MYAKPWKSVLRVEWQKISKCKKIIDQDSKITIMEIASLVKQIGKTV